MSDTLNLNQFPRFVRYSLGLLLAGWLGHFVFIYLVFVAGQETPESKIIYQQVVIVSILGYFLYHGKNWARVFCLLCNSLIFLIYLCYVALFWTSITPMILGSMAVAGGCFSVASYFLMTREAKAFYARPADRSASSEDDP
jgi:hypothetical protein